MQKQFIILILIHIFYLGCSAKENYKEVSKKALRQEIKITKAPSHLQCSWYYKYSNFYHMFSYVCIPNKKPKGSFLVILKRYKIKKELLKIDNVDENIQQPVESIKIYWEQ